MPKIGQNITVFGRLKEWEIAGNPGEFSQKDFYRIQKLDFLLKEASIVEKGENYNHFQEGLVKIKNRIEMIFDTVWNGQEAALMKAILLGSKKGLEKETKTLFQEAGIAHILAISGLHISLIGMGFYRLLKKIQLPYKVSLLLATGFIISYGLMTGMSTSAIRAIIMFGMQILAKALGRTYDLLTSLCVAGALLLIEQPLYLQHAGFLLSFGAVLGIALLSPVLKRGGLSVFFFTMPIMVWYFYEISIYSVLLNLLIIPLLTVLTVAGLAALMLFLLWPSTGCLIGIVCSMILGFYESVSRLSLSFPESVWRVGRPETVQVIFYCLLLGILVWKGQEFSNILTLIWLVSSVFILTAYIPVSGIQVTMLDVGQGDCFLLRTKEAILLIDGGSSSKKNVGEYQILPALKYYGIREIDYIFISHMDEDHCNGVKQLLAEVDITCKSVFVPRAEGFEEDYPGLETLVEQAGGKMYRMEQGNFIRSGELIVRCLYPEAGQNFSDSNATSLVLEILYEDFSGLFTGDLGQEQEVALMPHLREGGYTLWKASHHGSNQSGAKPFLQAVSPEMTMISCGKNNVYGHPGALFLERLSESQTAILETNGKGAVTVEIN